MKKYASLGLLFLAGLGLYDATILTIEHFRGTIPPCSAVAFADCGKVLTSEYAVWFGVPLALIGLIHYAVLGIQLVATQATTFRFPRYGIVIQSAIGAIMSLAFVYLQVGVIGAICLYCMLSAVTSLGIFVVVQYLFRYERKSLARMLFGWLYKYVFRRIAFLFPPELVHEQMITFGRLFASNGAFKKCVSFLFHEAHPNLKQEIHGISFTSPIGLAAGFDYTADLTQTLAPWGFGFQSVGTITCEPYEGNAPPRLGRLVKSKSLMVNKGYKNPGATDVIKKLSGKTFPIPLGISVGKSNVESVDTQDTAIKDIIATFTLFENALIDNTYYELNISCPNLKGSVEFYSATHLEALLQAVDELALMKPLFVKMPIDKTDEETRQMLEVIAKHSVQGVIIGNLQKDRSHPSFHGDELAKFPTGNFSGKPTYDRSNELISLCYKNFKDRFTIIGCGGVFSAEDAFEKIARGARLIELITGMIFEGPHVITTINAGLLKLLKEKGFDTIHDAVGTYHSAPSK